MLHLKNNLHVAKFESGLVQFIQISYTHDGESEKEYKTSIADLTREEFAKAVSYVYDDVPFDKKDTKIEVKEVAAVVINEDWFKSLSPEERTLLTKLTITDGKDLIDHEINPIVSESDKKLLDGVKKYLETQLDEEDKPKFIRFYSELEFLNPENPENKQEEKTE